MPFETVAKFARSKKKPAKKGEEKEKEKKELTFFSAVYSVIKSRRSIRKFQPKKVSIDIINILLQAASHAPSAGNQQPWEFIVVRDKKEIEQIARACFNQAWVVDAPVVIVAGINMRLAEAIYGERGKMLYGIQSVAAAIENMILTATSLGLGTCWIGAFSEPEITFAVEFPEYVRPCAVIVVGYPDEKPKPPPRHSLNDFVHFEKFRHLPKYVQ